MRLQALMLTVGGLGHVRPASGTWGSMPTCAATALALVILGPHWGVDLMLVVICLVFSAACVIWGAWGEQQWGRKDPSEVVADEAAGQAIALLALPWRDWSLEGAAAWNFGLIAAAFLLFRLLDILKPPPASQAQRLPAGWGILVDDLAAGAYVVLILQASRLLS